MSESTESKPFLDLKGLAALLIKHFGHKEGLYDVAFGIKVAVGQVGPGGADALPGAAFGISSVGLVKVAKKAANTVDAGELQSAVREKRAPQKGPAKRASKV
jgi:hypothetical protein